jgi:hypothetical protein
MEDGETPTVKLTGDTTDISHLLEFSSYGPIWHIDMMDLKQNKKLGRYLCPSYDIGQAMCSKILTVKGKVISRTSVIPLMEVEKHDVVVRKQIEEYDKALPDALGDRARGIDPPESDEIEQQEQEFVPY